MTTVLCYVHGTPFPKAACHEHHEMPRAAGGGDQEDNLTFVCATCHNLIHRCAEAILGGRMGVAQDLALQYSPNVIPMRERLLRLAGYAADMLRDSADDPMAGPDDVILSIQVPREIAQRLKLVIADRRANGRRVSQQAFLLALIVQQVQKAGLMPTQPLKRKPPTKRR